MKPALALLLLAPLGACATTGGGGAAASAPRAALPSGGLQTVMGQNAAGLTRLFGTPDADVREGNARKLQFTSAICVMDTYLYPKGNAEPRVTWLDTRERDGSPIDRASCVAALARRDGGR